MLRGIGQTLVTLGVVVLLFIVYEVFVTDLLTARKQDELTEQLHRQWESDPSPGTSAAEDTDPADGGDGPDPTVGSDPTVGPGGTDPGAAPPDGVSVAQGEPFAVLWIPAFGADYARVVLEGTSAAVLAQGPGHYVGTAGPGEVGNFALAGHRVGRGSPFLDLDALEPADAIVVETQDHWFVYRVIGDAAAGTFTDPAYPGIPGQHVTSPAAVEVVAPVPGRAGGTPTQRLLTLTTCHPRFSAAQRLVVHGYLDGAPLAKTDHPGPGDVPALNGG